MLINTGFLFTKPPESAVNSYFRGMVPGSLILVCGWIVKKTFYFCSGEIDYMTFPGLTPLWFPPLSGERGAGSG
jgi:hypothetical protein